MLLIYYLNALSLITFILSYFLNIIISSETLYYFVIVNCILLISLCLLTSLYSIFNAKFNDYNSSDHFILFLTLKGMLLRFFHWELSLHLVSEKQIAHTHMFISYKDIMYLLSIPECLFVLMWNIIAILTTSI
jgi:hypothetical protein